MNSHRCADTMLSTGAQTAVYEPKLETREVLFTQKEENTWRSRQ